MSRWKILLRATGLGVASLAVIGCTSTQEMTPRQREAVELRRYCEQHPDEVEKCLGFLGWR